MAGVVGALAAFPTRAFAGARRILAGLTFSRKRT
jgi:hypothetical protein